jgi:hypothetical protein
MSEARHRSPLDFKDGDLALVEEGALGTFPNRRGIHFLQKSNKNADRSCALIRRNDGWGESATCSVNTGVTR